MLVRLDEESCHIMQILPVLDLLGGVVVRGVAGQRERYRPIVSRIVDVATPIDVARAFRRQFGLSQLYVADLDAILHHRPNFEIYRQLADDQFDLLIDAGIRDLETAAKIFESGAGALIAGLETTPNPQFLSALIRLCGQQRLIFSIDLKAGQLLTAGTAWRELTPLQLAKTCIHLGVDRLIILDLAQVGSSNGISTLSLCADIRKLAPEVQLITGGGIRHLDDLQQLAAARITGVLIASALHDGQISRDDLDQLNRL